MVETVGDRIEKAINDSGLKKAEIARRVNVSPQAITKWSKKGSIEKKNLLKFCNITGASYEWIMTGKRPANEINETRKTYSINSGLLKKINSLNQSQINRLEGYIDALIDNKIIN